MNVILLIWLLVGTGIVRGLKFIEYESEAYCKSYVLIMIWPIGLITPELDLVG
jgi:hypothetical protein